MIVSLRTTINGHVNVISYISKDFVSHCLWSISHNDYSTFSHLHVTREEHDNTMDEDNRRESIGFYISI